MLCVGSRRCSPSSGLARERHSSLNLTAKLYLSLGLRDLLAAVNKLPADAPGEHRPEAWRITPEEAERVTQETGDATTVAQCTVDTGGR